jgi:hypothetical protein
MLSDHPSAEDLAGYAGRALAPARLLAVDDHLVSCASCRERLTSGAAVPEAAAALRSALAEERNDARPAWTARWFTSRRAALAPAAAVALVAVAAVVLLRVAPGRGPGVSGRLAGASPPRATDPSPTAPLPAVAEAALTRARATGTLAVPPEVLELVRGGERTRGALAVDSFRPTSPVGTAVESETPWFQWRARPGAADYVVTVFDPSFNLVMTSAPVEGTRWRAEGRLDRGKVYLWQVTARTRSGEETAPRPPQPPAAFRVLTGEESRQVHDVREAAGGSALTLAVGYAAVGLLEDAERELSGRVARPPDDVLSTRLLEHLRRVRSGQGPAAPSATNPAQ